MSTSIMAACWPLKMPPTPKAVLISLADNANDQGHCWPSIQTISDRTCFSKRAVIQAISWLEQAGVVTADRTNGRHTEYHLNPSNYRQPVQHVHQCTSRTGASPAPEPVHVVHQPVHLPHQPVHEVHTNRQEPSRTVKATIRQSDRSSGDDLGMLLKDGSTWTLPEDEREELAKAYPNADIEHELRGMRVWLRANPAKRKTAKGMPRFVMNWLSRSEKGSARTEGASYPRRPAADPYGQRRLQELS